MLVLRTCVAVQSMVWYIKLSSMFYICMWWLLYIFLPAAQSALQLCRSWRRLFRIVSPYHSKGWWYGFTPSTRLQTCINGKSFNLLTCLLKWTFSQLNLEVHVCERRWWLCRLTIQDVSIHNCVNQMEKHSFPPLHSSLTEGVEADHLVGQIYSSYVTIVLHDRCTVVCYHGW